MTTVDHSTDYLVLDNTESVTLTVVSAKTVSDAGIVTESGGTVVTVDNAFQRAVNLREISEREVRGDVGVIKAGDVIWILPIAQVGTSQLKPGDRIVDAATSTTWTVIQAKEIVFQGWWRCITRKV